MLQLSPPGHRDKRLPQKGGWIFVPIIIAVAALAYIPCRANSGQIASIPHDLVESGVPSFVILSPEALGLRMPPSDLQLMPDGRVLVVAQHEIAFGDGVRWEIFRSADERKTIVFDKVAVDANGEIYTGTEGKIARVEIGSDARWRLNPVVAFAPETGLQNAIVKNVTVVRDDWYWNESTGRIVAWQPGKPMRVVGEVGAIERVFAIGQKTFASSNSSGELFRLDADSNTAIRISPPNALSNGTITSWAPYGPGILLVGTLSAGLQLFDGVSLKPFESLGVLGNNQRISDLCVINDRIFAAAIETFGIVFFDREGRVVQVLDRTLDHRLASVRQLRYATNGVLWAVLSDGVARVEFPSQFSRIEPLLPSGVNYARPIRYEGRLWMLTDGHALRGVYDDGGRLERFEDDTPPGLFTWSMMIVDGMLIATSETGIYARDGKTWKTVIAGISRAHLGYTKPDARGWFYAARGEIGWIKKSSDGYTATRFPEPELAVIYKAMQDVGGSVWLELGLARIGRVDLSGDQPKLTIFGTKNGLSSDWVNAYVWDGITRFTQSDHHYRFDEAHNRFYEDTKFAIDYPEQASARARPAYDGRGRPWFAANGNTYMVDAAPTGNARITNLMPVGFEPSEFTMEGGGVVWIWANRRLMRYDPDLPKAPLQPLKAIINYVQFNAVDQHVFSPGPSLPPISYDNNSFIIHFAAPANPFESPVSFEIMIEGGNARWTSTGNVGSAAFNRLREGHYIFHVRPVAGWRIGEEAKLEFTVRPPWFRAPLAWMIYILTALGTVMLIARLSSLSQRREKERLAHIVAERTRELQASEDRCRQLAAELGITNAERQDAKGKARDANVETTPTLSKKNIPSAEDNPVTPKTPDK